MMYYFIILYMLTINFQNAICQDNINTVKLVLLQEKGQDYIVEWFKEELKLNKDQVTFDLNTVNLEHGEEDEEKICDELSKGGDVLIDITWSGNDEALKLSKTGNWPYLRIDLSISPALNLLDQYLDYRNSSDVCLIFGNSEDVDQALYFWIDTTRLRMAITETLDKISAERIRNIRPVPNNYAIVANTESVDRLFKVAIKENLVLLPERWNLVFLDFKHKYFKRELLEGKPINLLTLDEELCCNLLDKDTCDCPEDFNMQNIFLSRVISIIYRFIYEYINEGNVFIEKLSCNTSDYNEDSIKIFYEILESKLLHERGILYEGYVFKINMLGSVEIGMNDGNANTSEIVANYNENSLTVVEGKSIKPIKTFYRIGITHAIPWSFKKVNKAGNMYWTGYCADFVRKLSKLMNFDFEFVEPKNGTFGKKIDGVWNGVIGDIATGETDLAITAMIMTADREEVVDFVAPYFEQTGISIVMRKPVRKTSLFKFMTVLKLEVWLSIVGALIVTGFMVWFLDKYSPYSARNNKEAYPYPCREFSLKESFWFALTSFTPQGGGEAPKALSGRTLVAAYWLFVVLMLATFTANLAAFLTVERMQAPVQSLEQLARQSRINYTVVKDSTTHQYFINMKNAEDTLYRMWKELTLNASTEDTQYRVWDYPIREQYGHILLAINDSNPVSSAAEGFRLVDEHLDADFAFIHDSSEIKYEISVNCNLTEVGEIFAEKPYAVAVQQGSHLQDEISKMILNLQKDRYFEKLQAKYWNHSAKGSCPNTDDNEGITLESLGGVFIATLFGLALAMITLICEVLYYRRKRKNLENQAKRKPIAFPEKHFPKKVIMDPYPPSVTIGTTFKPVKTIKERDPVKISHIALYPRARNRITQINN